MASLTFFAAINAARNEGKRVRPCASSLVAFWDNHGHILKWLTMEPVQINEYTLTNSWQIIPDPPKRYSFMEAVEMMKQGRKMWINKPRCDSIYTIYDNRIVRIGEESSGHHAPLNLVMIESQWEEVQ